METVYNAEKKSITVAGSVLEVFMLPDGTFLYSRTSAAAALKKGHQDAANFFSSNTAKAILGNELTPPRLVKVGRTRINGLTDVETAAYWQWKAENGNIEAKALMMALATEALYRRSCIAFGLTVTEEQVEERTQAIREELVKQLSQAIFEAQRAYFGTTAELKAAKARGCELIESNQMTWEEECAAEALYFEQYKPVIEQLKVDAFNRHMDEYNAAYQARKEARLQAQQA